MAVMEFLLSQKLLANFSPFVIRNQKILQISAIGYQLKSHRLLSINFQLFGRVLS